jgi:TetR/AcrR family fatty acid metabolism transcriptional regulator
MALTDASGLRILRFPKTHLDHEFRPMPAAQVKISAAPDSVTEVPARSSKRDHILDAAIVVFARLGYHGARISDIAREAGIAYGLVYHYFKNKEEILNTIFEERWSGFLEAVEEITESQRPIEDKLVSIAALMLNAHRLRPEWVKVLVLEIQRSSRFAEPTQIRAVGRFFQLIERLVREGQESGELRGEVDPEVASYVFVGALELVITARVLDVLRVEAEAESRYYEKVARTVADLFLRGLGREGER